MLFVLLLFCYFDKLKFIIMIFKTPYYFSCKEYSYSLIVLCLIMLSSCQKDIQSKQDDYFENLFGQLTKLESRLGEMDAIMNMTS